MSSSQDRRFLQILLSICLSFYSLNSKGQTIGEFKVAPIWGLKIYNLFTESINEFGGSYEFLAFQRLGIEVGALTRKNHSELCVICLEDGYDWRSLGITLNIKYYVDGPGKYSGLYIAVAGASFTHLNSAEFRKLVDYSKKVFALLEEYQRVFLAKPMEIGGMLGYKVLLWKRLVLEPVAFYGHDFNFNSDVSSRAAITFKLGYRF